MTKSCGSKGTAADDELTPHNIKMRFFSQQHTYQHDWDTVTAAFWVKYPNSFQPHVLRVDTVDREFDEENQRFTTRRIISLHYNIPGWVQRLLGTPSEGYGVEEATCDLKAKTLTLRSHNYTFSNILRVDETCVYSQHPENPSWTVYTQKASYWVVGFGCVCKALEIAAVKAAHEKSEGGLSAMQGIISRLEAADWKAKCSCAAAAAADKYAGVLRALRQWRQEEPRCSTPPPSAALASSSAAGSIEFQRLSAMSYVNAAKDTLGNVWRLISCAAAEGQGTSSVTQIVRRHNFSYSLFLPPDRPMYPLYGFLPLFTSHAIVACASHGLLALPVNASPQQSKVGVV